MSNKVNKHLYVYIYIYMYTYVYQLLKTCIDPKTKKKHLPDIETDSATRLLQRLVSPGAAGRALEEPFDALEALLEGPL